MARYIGEKKVANFTVKMRLAVANDHVDYVEDGYKTLRGAVAAVIKARYAEKLGNYYGHKNKIQNAAITDAAGNILLTYKRRYVGDGSWTIKEIVEIAESAEAEIDKIAENWANRNAELVKKYEGRTSYDLYAMSRSLERVLTNAKKAEAAVDSATVEGDDVEDSREYFDVEPVDEDDDDNELDSEYWVADETETEKAVIEYVPRPESEAVEVKTELEIAHEEMANLAEEFNKLNITEDRVAEKKAERENRLQWAQTEYSEFHERYKISSNEREKDILRRRMKTRYEEIAENTQIIEELQELLEFVEQKRDEVCDKISAAEQALKIARENAGVKYSVYVSDAHYEAHRIDTKTLSAAVEFVSGFEGDLTRWTIKDITNHYTDVAYGRESFDAEALAELVRKYDGEDTSIEAEIVQPIEKVAVRYDSPAAEFKAIVVRAIHYFTLDDFITPIEELRAFVKRTGYSAAQNELNEWIQMAKAAGVEVPVAEFEAITLVIEDYTLATEEHSTEEKKATFVGLYDKAQVTEEQSHWWLYEVRASYYEGTKLQPSLIQTATREPFIDGKANFLRLSGSPNQLTSVVIIGHVGRGLNGNSRSVMTGYRFESDSTVNGSHAPPQAAQPAGTLGGAQQRAPLL